MHSSTLFVALTVAAGVSGQALVTYNCNDALEACKKDVGSGNSADSICEDKLTACEGCATQEHSCRVGADGDYSGQLECTTAAQTCYEMAVSGGTTLGYYGCEEAFNSCSIAPMTNHSFCASQKAACESCQKMEEKCRTAPGANQSYCSSQAGSCFADAMKL